jgi:hypothetical protein
MARSSLFGPLVVALTRGLGAYQRGKVGALQAAREEQRRKRREVREEALARSLIEQRHQQPSDTWDIRETRTGNLVQVHKRTGEVRPLLHDGKPVLAPARRDPTQILQKQPQVTEREKASFAVLATHANEVVNWLEQQDPAIAARVARKAATWKTLAGGVGRRLLGASDEQVAQAAEVQVERSMTPEELEYYSASKQYLSNVLPALSGKAVTAREFMMQAPAYFSMGSPAPEALRLKRDQRARRVRGFWKEAGPAAEERLPDVGEYDLTPYGLPNVPRERASTARGPNVRAPAPRRYRPDNPVAPQ